MGTSPRAPVFSPLNKPFVARVRKTQPNKLRRGERKLDVQGTSPEKGRQGTGPKGAAAPGPVGSATDLFYEVNFIAGRQGTGL